LTSLYGIKPADKYVEFIKQEPSQYIRVNQLKANKKVLAKILKDNYRIKTEEIPFIPNGLKVTGGNELLGKTIEHINGLYYMQGLSSMLPPLILSPSSDEIVLDLCSAPGSKTTELGEIMNNKGTLIANEIQLDRVKMLVYNIDRMNLMNAGVIHYKGEWLGKIYSNYFDKILVDAPCSGLGIIQKKGEVNTWWSTERAKNLGELQLKLLVAAIKMLKPGGEIVYSTCTLTVEENELVINKVLNKYPVEVTDIKLSIISHDGFTKYNGESLNPSLSKGKRIFPWEADSDGFFIIKLKKIGETEALKPIQLKPSPLKFLSHEKKEIQNLLNNVKEDFGIDEKIFADYKYLIKGTDIFFINKNWNDENLSLFERIGTRFGVIDKNGEVTLHTQAAQILDKGLNKNIYTIDNQDELKIYLEGGIIKKDIGYLGQCVVKYQNYILGTAVVTNHGIKSRFPRAKRTQEIFTNF